MLQPIRSKFRKAHKGRIHGVAKAGTELNFGQYGLKAMEPERVSARQIEADDSAAQPGPLPVPPAITKQVSPENGRAVVSIVTLSEAEATLVLPAMSVSLSVKVWTPCAKTELVIDQLPEPSATPVPSTVVPLVS